MKKLLRLFIMILSFGIFASCGEKDKVTPAPTPAPEPEKSTVIYIVRHAEKSSNHPSDPDLSLTGIARAAVLKDSLAGKNIAAVYATNYKRTQQTGQPTASARNLTISTYDAGNISAVAAKVLKDNLNQTILIVGHSNTVLETIEAFNATRPISVINDSEYNYLFKLTLKENKAPVVEVKRYGK
jgi:broad specificity phosphatase PhoE